MDNTNINKKPLIKISPSVKFSSNFFFDEAFRIFFTNILPEDAAVISDKFKGVNNDVFIVKANGNKSNPKKGLIIYADSNRLEEFYGKDINSLSDDSYFGQIFHFMYDTFKSDFRNKAGQYVKQCYYRCENFNEMMEDDENEVNENDAKKNKIGLPLRNLFEIVIRLILGTATKKDIANRDAKIAHNWAQIANTLNNPETREKLLKYQLSGTFKKIYGWNLSGENISFILAQKPDAAFVLTASQWRIKYKRIIKPGAEKLFMVQPSKNIKPTPNEIATASTMRGWEGKLFTGSQQVDHGNRIAAQSMKPANGMFGKLVYDVTDTELMPGVTEDLWSIEMGFINEFTGELNQSAIIDAQETENAISKEKEKEEKDEKQIRLEQYMTKAAANLEEYCQKKNIKYMDSVAINDKLSNLIYSISLTEAERVNIIKPTNQERFAKACTYMIMAMIGAPYSTASSYVHKGDWSDEDGSVMYSTYIKIYRIMNKENKNIEQVKESYNAILNRLNNVIL